MQNVGKTYCVIHSNLKENLPYDSTGLKRAGITMEGSDLQRVGEKVLLSVGLVMNEKNISGKSKLFSRVSLFGTLAAKIAVVINDDIEVFKSDGQKPEINSIICKI